MAPPAVNTPFRDPDFGSRMVRVTDANTMAGSGSYFVNFSFMTDASAETNVWSVFDPTIGLHGGYRFFVITGGGGKLPFILDATTMQISRPVGRQGGYLSTYGALNFAGSFSFTNPDILYGMQGTQLVSYNFATDALTPIYDLSGCPNLPPYVSGYGGTVSNSGDDTKFSYYLGGTEQGNTTLAVYYDRTANGGAGACYWYDTEHGLVGGTNMAPTPVAGSVGQITAPAAPVVTATPGVGRLPAGSYYVKITTLTQMNPHDGETPPSAEVGPIYLPSPGIITVTFPAVPDPYQVELPGTGCTISYSNCGAFNVYIGTSRGGERLQNTWGPVGRPAYTQSGPLNMYSVAPPVRSSAGYNVHNARISKDGTAVRLDSQQGQTIYFWKAGTNQVTTCLFSGEDCGGHQALGYAHMLNDPNNSDMADVLIRPLSNPAALSLLVNPLPMPRQWNDSHWSWNDANVTDTMPVCGSFYNSHGHGNGTQNVQTNPLLQIAAPYDREIVCVATSGPSKVWRFAHNRATSALNDNAWAGSSFWASPRGNVSPDGRFYMFTSDWEWSLGNQKNTWGCPWGGHCRTDVFIVELH